MLFFGVCFSTLLTVLMLQDTRTLDAAQEFYVVAPSSLQARAAALSPRHPT